MVSATVSLADLVAGESHAGGVRNGNVGASNSSSPASMPRHSMPVTPRKSPVSSRGQALGQVRADFQDFDADEDSIHDIGTGSQPGDTSVVMAGRSAETAPGAYRLPGARVAAAVPPTLIAFHDYTQA